MLNNYVSHEMKIEPELLDLGQKCIDCWLQHFFFVQLAITSFCKALNLTDWNQRNEFEKRVK